MGAGAVLITKRREGQISVETEEEIGTVELGNDGVLGETRNSTLFRRKLSRTYTAAP